MDASYYISKQRYSVKSRDDNIVSSSDNLVSSRDNTVLNSDVTDLRSDSSVCRDNESVGSSNDSGCSSNDTVTVDREMGVLGQVMQLASGKASPILDAVKSENDYEEMRLEASTWVSTTISGVYHELARIAGFKLLLAYTMGQNEDGVQLKMTPPILTRVTSSGNKNFETTFTVSICVQTEEGKRLPEPTNELVYIEQFPAMFVFVKKVEGLVSEEIWLFEARKLAESLQHKEHIRTDVYFTAAYENPLQLMCKDNEVWLVKYENEGAIVPLKKDNTIHVGDQRLPVPRFVVKVIGFIVAYFTFLISCVHAVINFGSFVRKNAALIKTTVKSTVNTLVKRNTVLNFVFCTSLWYYNICLNVMQWTNKLQKYR